MTTAPPPHTPNRNDWIALAHSLGERFAARAAEHDADDSFVAENYADLKARRVFSAGVPADLGGGGASHAELCGMLRTLAQHCGSTALALSMHTHLVAVAAWRCRHEGRRSRPCCAGGRRGAGARQQRRLGLAGGRAGRAVEGGYRVTARKIFCSGCPSGTC